MNNTLVSLASLATVGSAMLLWKLLTGEQSGADGAAGQEKDSGQDDNAAPSAETACSSYEEAGIDMSGSFTAAEASAAWTDASSQLADDDVAGDVGQDAQGQQPAHASEQGQQSGLQASESFVSAASTEGDAGEVSSAVTGACQFTTPTRSAAYAPIAASAASTARSSFASLAHQEEPAAPPRQAQAFNEGRQKQEMDNSREQQPWEPMPHQQQQQDGVTSEEDGGAAEAAELQDPAADAADSSRGHKRQSSSEQVVFGPIEPRFALGGFLGQWDAGNRGMAGRSDHNQPGAEAESAEQLELREQEQGFGEQQQQQSPPRAEQHAQLQERKLQPLNLAAAADALDQQHAMTDALWASLRTVEVAPSQSGGDGPVSSTSSSLPPLPRPPSASAAVTTAPVSGVMEHDSDSDSSEDNCKSAFALPLKVMSAVGASTGTSCNATGGTHTVHSRHASRAMSGSGSLLCGLGDWPSIQLQSSLPSESKAADNSSLITEAVDQQPPKQQQQQQTAVVAKQAAADQSDKHLQQHGHQLDLLLSGSGQPFVGAVQQTAGGLLPAPATAAQQQQYGRLQQSEQPTICQMNQAAQQTHDSEQRQVQQPLSCGETRADVQQQQQQQQLAVDLLPGSKQPQQQPLTQPVEQQQSSNVQQPAAQDDKLVHPQQQLLQPELTLPAKAGSANNSLCSSNSLRSRKQQQHWKQLLQQEQQQNGQSPAQAADAPAAGAATSSHSHGSKSMLLQTVEAGGAVGSNSTNAGRLQLLTQPKDSSGSGSNDGSDAVMADLAAGLTAPRSWRPSRTAHGSMVGPSHSKLSIMTTAADGALEKFRSSVEQQHQQQRHIDSNASNVSSCSGVSTSRDGSAAAGKAEDGPWLRLVVSGGPAAGRSFHTRDRTAELVIGRSPMSWAAIPDQEISGKHACLSWSNIHNCWQVADAGSLNGTSLNGKSISRPSRQSGHPAALKHGDRLELGSITSAVVECGPGQQQAEAALVLPPVQQQQQQHKEDLLNQTRNTPSPSKQQQELVTGQLQHAAEQQSNGALPRSRQPQQLLTDSRYNTWTAGHPSPSSSNSSNATSHRQSLDYPSSAAVSTFHRIHGSVSRSGNGSCSGTSDTGLCSISSAQAGLHPQLHYRTGGGLSSAGSSSCCQSSPASPAGGGLLAPLIMLRFLDCRVEGAVVKMVGADHRRNHSPCEDVVAWRTPLADWSQVGLFCIFDGHHSRNASEQAQELLPKLLSQHLLPTQQQPQQEQQQQHHSNRQQSSPLVSSSSTGHAYEPACHLDQQQSSQQALLADEPAVAAALTASFLETDKQLTCDDGCTATAVLLEGCADGSVMMRVANVGDSMAVLVDLSNAGWRSLTEDHRIAGNPTEAARLTAKNHNVPGGVSTRLYGLNIARMLGDRFLKEQDVGFTAEPYISEGVILGPSDEVLLLVASDGLWDVVSQERAASLAGKAVAERTGLGGQGGGVAAAGAAAAVSAASECSGNEGGGDTADDSVQDASEGNSTVAAAVAEALMHAALSLRSRDDISIMVLHVLPAAVAGSRAAAGSVSISGSM